MDRRKAKAKVKHGISSRDTLKQQSESVRALKRSEATKRFRAADNVAGTHESVELSLEALHKTVQSIKVVCLFHSLFLPPGADANPDDHIFWQTMDESVLPLSMIILRQFMTSDDAPIQAVIESGVIENLIQMLSYSNVALILDVLW